MDWTNDTKFAKRQKWDARYLDLAKTVSTWSRDPSTQTGAVIVSPKNHIVSVGYNGFPAGMPDNEELYVDRDEKLSRIIHCEINAFTHAERNIAGCTIYTWPFLSCDRCYVTLSNAGVLRFVAPRGVGDNRRWDESFEKTRRYAKEMGVEVCEL